MACSDRGKAWRRIHVGKGQIVTNWPPGECRYEGLDFSPSERARSGEEGGEEGRMRCRHCMLMRLSRGVLSRCGGDARGASSSQRAPALNSPRSIAERELQRRAGPRVKERGYFQAVVTVRHFNPSRLTSSRHFCDDAARGFYIPT